MGKIFALLLLLPATILAASDNVSVFLRNDSDRGSVTVSWVHPQSGSRTLLLQVGEGGEKMINSFVGHTFEMEEIGECQADASCRGTQFSVTKSPEQSFILDVDFRIVEVADLHRTPKKIESPNERMSRCRDQAKRRLRLADSTDKEAQGEITAEFASCLKKGVAPALQKATDEIVFARTISQEMGSSMENFTCIDPELPSSPDVRTHDWISEKDGKQRTVHVKLDRPTSRIHVVGDFAGKDECEAMKEAAEDKLRRASTADGKGGSKVSENRKAMQAGITPKWELEEEGDLIARLSRRVYEYVNYELGMSLEEHGQEPLMSIQYFGRGHNDTSPDRYTPHCDGPCEGEPFIEGGRMATMVIYCDGEFEYDSGTDRTAF